MLFTFHVMIVSVPPETDPKNGVCVTTVVVSVAGDNETVIFVTGSVQATEDDVVDDVAAVVVHVSVVAAGAVLHEARPSAPKTNSNKASRLTAPRSSAGVALLGNVSGPYDSCSIRRSKSKNQVVPQGTSFVSGAECAVLELLEKRTERNTRGIRAEHIELRRVHRIQHVAARNARGILQAHCGASRHGQ